MKYQWMPKSGPQTYIRDDDYVLVPPTEEKGAKGIQCGQCGMTFDHNKAYGFVCANMRCPVQPKVT